MQCNVVHYTINYNYDHALYDIIIITLACYNSIFSNNIYRTTVQSLHVMPDVSTLDYGPKN